MEKEEDEEAEEEEEEDEGKVIGSISFICLILFILRSK